MNTFKKKHIQEMVGGDIFSSGSDRNVTNNSEIETGPVQKPYNDDSDYEVGVSTTTDKVTKRYRQDIPWFAVYSYGGARQSRSQFTENKNIITKESIEEIIEDLISKKSKDTDIIDKNNKPNISDLVKMIKDIDFSEEQLEKLEKAVLNKMNSNKTI